MSTDPALRVSISPFPSSAEVTPSAGASFLGPASTATPVLVITNYASGSCALEKTLVPTTVVYSDGNTLTTDHVGYFCEPVPQVIAGRVELTWFRTRLDGFFADVDANPIATETPEDVGVSDGTTTAIAYTGADGHRHAASAFALDLTPTGLPTPMKRRREAVRVLLAELTARVQGRTPWIPKTVEVVSPVYPRLVVPTSVAWPVPVSPAVANLLAGPAGGCIDVTGPDVERILTAQRDTLADWKIGGQVRTLAIGVALPGLPTCVEPP